jgi:hypothetical protein
VFRGNQVALVDGDSGPDPDADAIVIGFDAMLSPEDARIELVNLVSLQCSGEE